MRSRRLVYLLITLAAIAAAGFAGYQYYASHRSTPPTAVPATDETDAQGISTAKPPKTYPVLVYFSKHPESDNDPSKVFGLDRKSLDLGVAKFVIKELLKGPTVEEKAAGYFSKTQVRAGPSNCDDNDFKLTVQDTVATLQFCRVFDHLGVVADGQAEREINATLKQFESVKNVIILNRDGGCEFDLSGQNLCKSNVDNPAPASY